jgi:zinc/manganese transport system substrate-binding protein
VRAGSAAVAALAVLVCLTGCSQEQRPATHGPVVVASTDVWGSVAQAVVGDHATVKAILDSAADDPHSHEASPAEAAEISDASLVVFNGGGYDRWVDDVLDNRPDAPRVDAYSLQPDPHANEHVFYDLATVKAAAIQIAEQLATIDADHADAYRANAGVFGGSASEILASERAIGLTHRGVSVVATEPVAHYLLANSGIADKTPKGFAQAVEQDTDPSPADLAVMLDLIDGRQVAAVLYNPQTETAVTKRIRDAATAASIPIVNVTETLPEGTDYLTWQRDTVQQLATQLDVNGH